MTEEAAGKSPRTQDHDFSRRLLLAGVSGLWFLALYWTNSVRAAWADRAASAERVEGRRAERFMRRAIALSRTAMETGDGGPFGAIIVRDDTIVGEGWNRVFIDCDPTAHGEMVAIRKAAQTLARPDLTGCDLYTSAQPCPMCLGAIYWSRIDRVYYGNSVKEVAAIGFDDAVFYQQVPRPPEQRHVPEVQLLADEAREVFRDYAAKPAPVPF